MGSTNRKQSKWAAFAACILVALLALPGMATAEEVDLGTDTSEFEVSLHTKVSYDTVCVHVQDENGVAVQGAEVVLNAKTATTDAAGDAWIDTLVADTTYTASATKPGYQASSTEFNFIGTDADQRVTIVMPANPLPKTSVKVEVVDTAGQALTGAWVGIDGIGTGSTDAAGTIVFSGLTPDKTYTITAAKDTYKAYSGTFVANGQGVRITLEKQPTPPAPKQQATISVTDAMGAPLSGAFVEVEGIGMGITDASGRVTFSNLDAGKTYNIQVSRSGYAPYSGTFVADGNIVSVSLQSSPNPNPNPNPLPTPTPSNSGGSLVRTGDTLSPEVFGAVAIASAAFAVGLGIFLAKRRREDSRKAA